MTNGRCSDCCCCCLWSSKLLFPWLSPLLLLPAVNADFSIQTILDWGWVCLLSRRTTSAVPSQYAIFFLQFIDEANVISKQVLKRYTKDPKVDYSVETYLQCACNLPSFCSFVNVAVGDCTELMNIQVVRVEKILANCHVRGYWVVTALLPER